MIERSKMDQQDQDAIQASLTAAMKKWIEDNCDGDWDVGYWYPEQASDMARAAALVVFASARGQHYYEKEA